MRQLLVVEQQYLNSRENTAVFKSASARQLDRCFSWSLFAHTSYLQLAVRKRPAWAASILATVSKYVDYNCGEIADIIRIAQSPLSSYWYYAHHFLNIAQLPEPSSTVLQLTTKKLAENVARLTFQAHQEVLESKFYPIADNSFQVKVENCNYGWILGQNLAHLSQLLNNTQFKTEISGFLIGNCYQ